ETDGSVYSGAEAALRALAHNPHEQWLLDWYEHSPVFAHTSEKAYRFVAGHRRFFSALTRLAWGRHVEPPTHFIVRWLFLRSLALIYLVAFVSLWVQIMGLVGSNGIVPGKFTLQAIRHGMEQAAKKEAARAGSNPQPIGGLARYHAMPTLC